MIEDVAMLAGKKGALDLTEDERKAAIPFIIATWCACSLDRCGIVCTNQEKVASTRNAQIIER